MLVWERAWSFVKRFLLAKEIFHNLCQSTSSIHCHRDVSNEETSQMTKPIDNKNDRLSILSHYAHNYGSIHCKPFDKAASVHLPHSQLTATLQQNHYKTLCSTISFLSRFSQPKSLSLRLSTYSQELEASEWQCNDSEANAFSLQNGTSKQSVHISPTMVNIHSATSQRRNKGIHPRRFRHFVRRISMSSLFAGWQTARFWGNPRHFVFWCSRNSTKETPKSFFLENVKGLLIHDKGHTIETILNVLRNDLDYYVPDPQIVNAMHFGVPQHRERVYIVGFRKDQCTDGFSYPQPTDDSKTFADIKEEKKCL